MERSSSRAVAPSLLLFAILYGGMVPLGGFLGAKQVSLGSLAVEAGIFPFLTLIAISSGIAELHGRAGADNLRSEEPKSEPQFLMPNSFAVLCFKKNTHH